MSLAPFITIISGLLILGGFIAIIFPIAPPIITIWFGIFVYAISQDFATVGQSYMLLISGIALATVVLDYTLSRSGSQRLKAGPWGVLGAVAGGVAGSLFGPIHAYLTGPIAGALIFELLRGRDQVYSYQTGNYTIVAFMGGTLVKLIAGVAMTGMFILRLQGKI